MNLADVHSVEMTEEEETVFNAAVDDPSTIVTEANAKEVLECLDDDIATIRHQLNAAKVEADTVGTLSADRQNWVRRASHALVWKLKQRGAVGARLDELRPKPPAPPPAPPVDKQIAQISGKVADKVALARVRIQQEEAIRQRKAEESAAKQRRMELSAARNKSQAEMFVSAAKTRYPLDENIKTWAMAREMFPDSSAWDEGGAQ
jgi:hypothetical protein